MSGHWAYIWPTYIASGLAISVLSALIWHRGRKLRQKLDLIERRKANLDQSPTQPDDHPRDGA